MEQYAEVVLDLAGNAVPGASVQVLVGSVNGSLATIYDAGGTPQQNPIPTGQRGEFAFQAANGKYVLRVLINGTPYATVGPLTFYDPNDDTRFSTLDTSLRPDIDGLRVRTANAETALGDVKTKLKEMVSVKDAPFNAKGDGATDDTAAIKAARDFASISGRALHFPNPDAEYLITSTIEITEFCPIIGEAAGLLSQYIGRQKGATRIRYTGAGPCFYVKPNPTPGTTTRLPYGQQFRNLIIQGTAAASHGIKVSDSSNINVAGMDLAGLQIDNVFVYDFKAGRGLEINFCFNNSIKNYVAETCGVAITLRYAHNTTFVGGSLEQSLVGLDAISCIDVNLHGTCMQGIDVSRIASQGLSVPANFFIWTGGWTGTGTSGATRTTAAHYAGTGVRNFGSIVRWFGGYEEGNTIGYLTELESDTAIYGKLVDLDTPVRFFAQFGIGAFAAHDICFLQGDKPNLVGVFHTERNYAAPLRIENPNFSTAMPENKKFTGPQGHSGVIDNWKPGSFRTVRTMRGMDVTLADGQLSHFGLRSIGGFNQEYRETVGATTSGTLSRDFAVGTIGTNLLQVVDGGDITVQFGDASRKVAGASLRIVVINVNIGAAVVRFDPASFAAGATSYSLPGRKQRVFKFFFDNGVWLEEGVDVPL